MKIRYDSNWQTYMSTARWFRYRAYDGSYALYTFYHIKQPACRIIPSLSGGTLYKV